MTGRTKNYLQYPARSGKLAVIYVRVSKNELTQQSIPGQVRIGMATAARLGYRIALDVGEAIRHPESGDLIIAGGVFRDEKPRGVVRKGLHTMLDVLDQRPDIGAVFFWEFQRMWGQPEQYRRLNTRAVKAGYKLMDENGKDFVSHNPDDLFIQQVNSAVSERETGTTGRRAKSQNIQKAKGENDAGRIVTRPVLGLWAEPFLNDEGKRRSRMHISGHDMAIVRRIYTEYADGARGPKIIQDLVRDDIRTYKQIEKNQPCVWYLRGILEILDNPIYIGWQRYNQRGTEWTIDDVTGDKIRHTRPRHPDEHLRFKTKLGVILATDPSDPTAVAEAVDLWNRVKARRDLNGRERPAKKHDGALQYLVRCGRCGVAMQRTNTGYTVRATGEQRVMFSYICPRNGVAGGRRCNVAHSMGEKKLFRMLRREAVQRASLGVAGEQVVSWKETVTEDPTARAIRNAQEMLSAKNDAVDRIHNFAVAGVYDKKPERFGQLLAVAEREVEAAEAALATLLAMPRLDQPAPTDASEEAVAAFVEFIDLLQDEAIPVADRRREAHGQLDRIEIDQPHVRVFFRSQTDAA